MEPAAEVLPRKNAGPRPAEVASGQTAGAHRLHTPEARRKAGRSKIANNGGSMLPTTDGRSLWARIRRDTYNAIIRSHLAGEASETQSLIARRVGTLEAELVFMEDKFAATRAAGDEPDPATVDLYGRLADRQRRLADPLGWQRTPRDVTPSLADIAAEIQAARSQGDTP
jgi:ribosomal protein L4